MQVSCRGKMEIMQNTQRQYYLHQGGYVKAGVCLFVC